MFYLYINLKFVVFVLRKFNNGLEFRVFNKDDLEIIKRVENQLYFQFSGYNDLRVVLLFGMVFLGFIGSYNGKSGF